MARDEFNPESFTSIPKWLKEQEAITKKMEEANAYGVGYHGKVPNDEYNSYVNSKTLHDKVMKGDTAAITESCLRDKLTDDFMAKDKRFDIDKRSKAMEKYSKSGSKITQAEQAECKRRVTYSVREAVIKETVDKFKTFAKEDPKSAFRLCRDTDKLVGDFLSVPSKIKLGK